MSSEAMHQILEQIEAHVHSRPSPIEFEMAYQTRVAIDGIRFAIKQTEQFAPRTDTIREAGLQLLDALERSESVERRFQQRSVWTEFLAPGWEAKREWQTDRGAVVTPNTTFLTFGRAPLEIGFEAFPAALFSMASNCAKVHGLLLPGGVHHA